MAKLAEFYENKYVVEWSERVSELGPLISSSLDVSVSMYGVEEVRRHPLQVHIYLTGLWICYHHGIG